MIDCQKSELSKLIDQIDVRPVRCVRHVAVAAPPWPNFVHCFLRLHNLLFYKTAQHIAITASFSHVSRLLSLLLLWLLWNAIMKWNSSFSFMSFMLFAGFHELSLPLYSNGSVFECTIILRFTDCESGAEWMCIPVCELGDSYIHSLDSPIFFFCVSPSLSCGQNSIDSYNTKSESKGNNVTHKWNNDTRKHLYKHLQ